MIKLFITVLFVISFAYECLCVNPERNHTKDMIEISEKICDKSSINAEKLKSFVNCYKENTFAKESEKLKIKFREECAKEAAHDLNGYKVDKNQGKIILFYCSDKYNDCLDEKWKRANEEWDKKHPHDSHHVQQICKRKAIGLSEH